MRKLNVEKEKATTTKKNNFKTCTSASFFVDLKILWYNKTIKWILQSCNLQLFVIFVGGFMNWKEILEKQFGSQILEAKIIEEDDLKLLDISVNYHDLNKVEEISKQLNEFIDSNYPSLDIDSLSIHSPGVELTYKTDELGKHIGEMLTIKLNKSIEKQDKFNGKLLEVLEGKIQISWNNKGQFRKVFIDKNNIVKVEKYIKFN
ncbi:conserved hypothetical protein [Mycoplasmopsis fermentans JER]|nr:conserved hypothetical protein [Mycoplasmopsis fermentans JER]